MKTKVNKIEPIRFICDNCLEDAKEVLLADGLQICGVCIEPEEPEEVEENSEKQPIEQD